MILEILERIFKDAPQQVVEQIGTTATVGSFLGFYVLADAIGLEHDDNKFPPGRGFAFGINHREICIWNEYTYKTQYQGWKMVKDFKEVEEFYGITEKRMIKNILGRLIQHISPLDYIKIRRMVEPCLQKR